MDSARSPRYTTRQGLLAQVEFRQQLINGSYEIRAYGIDQQDPGAFVGQPGDRQFRGSIEAKGQFALNDKWVWGFDGVLLSDYFFLSDYRLAQYKDPLQSFLNLPTDAISQLYLTGVGNRSSFDARTIYYLSFSGLQNQVPVVAPVIDYSNVINYSVLGGEVSYKGNFTSLSRETAAFDATNAATLANGSCLGTSADPAHTVTPANCLLRGVPGTYTRATGEVDWRRSFTDSWGEIWTLFASLRADAIDASISNQPGVSNFLPTGDSQALRVIPSVGLEYRYPFINVQPWGHYNGRTDRAGHHPAERTLCRQIAQRRRPELRIRHRQSVQRRQVLRLRPGRGRRPRQCWRAGGHAVRSWRHRHHGVRTVLQVVPDWNSFAVADATNTAINSGLDKSVSDYVASISYSPNRTYSFAARGRFDEATGSANRFEAEGRANFDRWSVNLLYGDYAPQPELGYLTRRDGILTSASVKIAANWVVTGSTRWDLVANQINQYVIGAGYVDDCFVLGLNYVTSYSYSAGTAPPTLNHAILFQIGLRTLGSTAASGGSGGIQ